MGLFLYMKLDSEYWNKQYRQEKAGWDIGYVSPPLREYFEQLQRKDLKILVPGAGNGYEVEYLHNTGFLNVYLLDFSSEVTSSFLKRNPDFPATHIFREDFFQHEGKYDLIIEQTFFTSIPRTRRSEYARKMNRLLISGGKLCGLLFNHEFGNSHPPFGGTEEEYRQLFMPYFDFIYFETAYNSIKPRKDREIFLCLRKKD